MNDFSIPRKGIHSLRIFDIAIVDLLLTFIFAIIISKKNFIAVFIILMLLSIVIHTLFNIRTKTNSWLVN